MRSQVLGRGVKEARAAGGSTHACLPACLRSFPTKGDYFDPQRKSFERLIRKLMVMPNRCASVGNLVCSDRVLAANALPPLPGVAAPHAHTHSCGMQARGGADALVHLVLLGHDAATGECASSQNCRSATASASANLIPCFHSPPCRASTGGQQRAP